MIYYIFIPIIFTYIYILVKYWKVRFLESIIITSIIFLGVNSLYFFVNAAADLSINVYYLAAIQVNFAILFVIRGLKIKKTPDYPPSGNELNIFLNLIFIICIFIINNLSIHNRFRLAIPSFYEDAANQWDILLRILEVNRFSSISYPFGFHGNAWFTISLFSNLLQKFKDYVFITNIFVLYLWYIQFLIVSIFSILINRLTNTINKDFLSKIIVSIISVTFCSIISFNFLEWGFYSNWFNHLFLFGFILFLPFLRLKNYVFWIPILFGFFYSYSFFMPVLLIYFGYKYYRSRDKFYLVLFIFTTMLSTVFCVQLFYYVGVKYLIVTPGGFFTYSFFTVILYIIFSVAYTRIKAGTTNKTDIILSSFGNAFLVFSVILAVSQLLFGGKLQYSFYKSLASVILIYGVFSSAGLLFLFHVSIGYIKKIKIYSIFIFSATIILVVYTVGLILPIFAPIGHPTQNTLSLNPSLSDLLSGQSNFFSNNSEKYNIVIYALENFDSYENLIYIDDDYQSTRWATGSYLRTKFTVIYDYSHVLLYKNYPYYISQLKKLNSKTIILNPVRLLEVDCGADKLIEEVNKSNGRVRIYPPFDQEMFNRNCRKSSSQPT